VDRNLNAVSLIRATLEPSGGGDAIHEPVVTTAPTSHLGRNFRTVNRGMRVRTDSQSQNVGGTVNGRRPRQVC